MDVANASASALSEIEDHISVVAAGYPMAQNGEIFQELCVAFQGRAIFFLLGELNLEHYKWNLARSVQARRFYLRKLREQGGEDPVFTALSRTESIFCTIAIDDQASVRELSELSPTMWMPAGEYEEDYCYYALVHALASGDRDSALRYLKRMINVLDGLDDLRVPFCESLLEGREADFWPAFSEFVDDRHDRAAVGHDDGRLVDHPWRAAFQFVSIEAIAWLKIAAASGFRAPEMEFSMCPSPTLNLAEVPQSPDIFLELESQFGI